MAVAEADAETVGPGEAREKVDLFDLGLPV